MANISKLSTGIRPIGLPGDYEQETTLLGETCAAGDLVRFDTSGNFTGANGTSTTENNWVGILLTGGIAGEAATAICKGKVAGFDVSALAFGASVFASDTDKTLGDVAGTASAVVGKVYPGKASGATRDKILKVGA